MKTKEADSISGMVIWVSANLGMMALFCFWATNGTLDVGAVPLGIQACLSCIMLTALSQIVWAVWLGVRTHDLPIFMAFGICFSNALLDAISLVYAIKDAPTKLSLWHQLGITATVAGVILERLPEFQRAEWRRHPENKGKFYMKGFFHYAVHVNYAGYTLWRFGIALLAQRWFILFLPAYTAYSFKAEIEEQRKHNSKKYGKAFDEYWNKTAKMVPRVW